MVEFGRPWWLFLLIPAVLLVLWIGRRTLSGAGTASRRVALVVRLLVVGLIVAALADPQWRKDAQNVSVTVVLDTSRSGPAGTQAQALKYIEEAKLDPSVPPKAGDKLGYVTVAREGRVQSLPQSLSDPVDIKDTGAADATNLEGGVRIAMAAMPQNAANRIVLISDGNETIGSLLAAARAAQAAKIPIDVLPITYSLKKEIVADRLIAPATAREGETAGVRVVLTSTVAATGRLNLSINGEPVDLDTESPSMGMAVALTPGTNVVTVPVKLPGRGAVRFDAIFEPDGASDTIAENNRATAVTFIGGQGRVLLVTSHPDEAASLLSAMREAKIQTEVRAPESAFDSLADLGAFECVLMVNTPAFAFSQKQQEELRSYVHDLGGGLVMVGGDEAFGAGGWIGSPLAEALPIKLDPPTKRQMPRGALVLVMHSCEVPEGNYWGRKTGEAAMDALSARDLLGIIEYDYAGGDGWVHPLSVLGNKSAAKRAINSLTYGDAPDFVSMLTASLAALKNASAGQKHVVIISDGDPAGPSDALLSEFVAAKITISTVAAFPHAWGRASADLNKMRKIAEFTGGTYHEITTNNALNTLPQIFIKEAQVVKRTLIWEGDPFAPAIVSGSAEPMRGITSVPGISGYVVGAEREGLAQVILRGPENDPILAIWQHGLGRVVTFTSDASTKWATAWVNWASFKQFWEQHVRWAMRPTGNPNVRVVTSEQGEETVVTVEALDDQGERLNFLRWQGAAVAPDGSAQSVDLRQVGPGRYEGRVRTDQSGAYTMQLGYEQTTTGGATLRGSVQAAITRPFADEFRAMRDNAALLEQVAKLTGGRVLPPQATNAELWSREGLTMPVSLRPIWLIVAMSAIGLFLVDVAVRRVRIDVLGMARAVRGAFKRGAQASAEQVGQLKAARTRAQAEMAKRAAESSSPSASSTKFEASGDELKAAKGGLDLDAPSAGTKPAATVQVKKADQGSAADAGEEGLSRLMKAKKRAQKETDET